MVQILVQLDDRIAAELERVAPAKSRKRSRFIALAIQKALMDHQDLETRAAYERHPDTEPVHFDPRTWGEWKPKRSKKRGKR